MTTDILAWCACHGMCPDHQDQNHASGDYTAICSCPGCDDVWHYWGKVEDGHEALPCYIHQYWWEDIDEQHHS